MRHAGRYAARSFISDITDNSSERMVFDTEESNMWGNVSTAFEPFEDEENLPTEFPTPMEMFPLHDDGFTITENWMIALYYAGRGILPETPLYHSMYRLRNLGAKASPITGFFRIISKKTAHTVL